MTDESSIRFTCEACGKHLRVSINQEGKHGKCPNCHAIVEVPKTSNSSKVYEPRIQFECSECGKKINVSTKYAGNTGKCPQCKTQLVVPNRYSEVEEKHNVGDSSVVKVERNGVVSEEQVTGCNQIENVSERRKIIWTITAISLFECALAIGGLIIGVTIGDEPGYEILPLLLALLVILIILIAVTAVITFINAIVIQIFTHWVCGFKLKYRTVYIACFLGNMASNLIMVPLSLINELIDDPAVVVPLALIASFFCFLIYTYILGLLLIDPEKGPIGFRKACLVLLMALLVCSIIGGVVGAVALLTGYI